MPEPNKSLVDEIKETLLRLHHQAISRDKPEHGTSSAAEYIGNRFENVSDSVDGWARNHTRHLPVPPHVARALNIDAPQRPMVSFEREVRDEGELD